MGSSLSRRSLLRALGAGALAAADEAGMRRLKQPERLRRIFQTAAVALAESRRQADMARPPRAALRRSGPLSG